MTNMLKLIDNVCLWWKKLNFHFWNSLFSGIALLVPQKKKFHWLHETKTQSDGKTLWTWKLWPFQTERKPDTRAKPVAPTETPLCVTWYTSGHVEKRPEDRRRRLALGDPTSWGGWDMSMSDKKEMWLISTGPKRDKHETCQLHTGAKKETNRKSLTFPEAAETTVIQISTFLSFLYELHKRVSKKH